ncbi:TPA: hypothetical protein OVM99_001857 [Staphylococcus aureus]|nr:hypothetical protein [Staphylococcus aureus]HDA7690130.1 hypothetical protein [Staphylococcus aureus]HDJ5164476.1 hypothetical protein [Staphylococcus aureus]
MRYIYFSIITLITGIIMHMTMYFVPFECRKMPLFMTIIFTVYFSNKKSTDYSVINVFTTETMSSCMTKVASLS